MSMSSSQSIRGSKVGSGPAGDVVRGDIAPSHEVSFYCANGHETIVSFAQEAINDIPQTWTCTKCGFDAGQDPQNPPAPPQTEVFKTHLDYVKERRSDAVGQQILDEALSNLRSRRG